MALKLALFGNPNCGKTTLFNNLTASSQYVGNWPGVTVEKKEGFLRGNKEIKIVDLPGIYSLTPYTDEEIVSRNFLFKEKPDLILNVVSALNLERSFYLTLQLLELNIPMVVVITMMDKVKKNNKCEIDFVRLTKMLNCKVLTVNSHNALECLEKTREIINLIGNLKYDENFNLKYSENFEKYIEKITQTLSSFENLKEKEKRKIAIRFLEKDEEFLGEIEFEDEEILKVKEILKDIEKSYGEDTKSVLIKERYDKIENIVVFSTKGLDFKYDVSDKIDSIVTNKFLAFPIFILVLGGVYYFCINVLGKPVSDYMAYILNEVISPKVEEFLIGLNVSNWLINLLVSGVFSGVGTVLIFIPQVFMLFLFLSLLEECGYMARVAFILDRLFLKFGLCGKSVISFLVSSGCGVNGIMATKTIKNENCRLITMVSTTFIPCNAKIPIIVLICSNVFRGSFFNVVLVYLISIVSIFIVGLVLKKLNSFKRLEPSFLMELGPYNLPNLKNTFYYTFSNLKAFIVKAGTIIFLASILIWFFLNYGFSNGSFGVVSQEDSILAHIGKLLTTIFVPLGFGNWQAVVATLSGLFAKENVVNTFGVVLNSSKNSNGVISFEGIFNGNFAALSFLVFNMLCAPCLAAIATIFKQTASLKETLKIIFFQTVSAYVVSLFVFQIGGLIFREIGFTACSIITFLVLFLVLIIIFSFNKSNKKI